MLFSSTGYTGIQGQGACWSWVHSKLTLVNSLVKEEAHFSVKVIFWLKIHFLAASWLHNHHFRLVQYRWMMGLEKKSLLKLQHLWRLIRHSTQILMDVTSLNGYTLSNYICMRFLALLCFIWIIYYLKNLISRLLFLMVLCYAIIMITRVDTSWVPIVLEAWLVPFGNIHSYIASME